MFSSMTMRPFRRDNRRSGWFRTVIGGAALAVLFVIAGRFFGDVGGDMARAGGGVPWRARMYLQGAPASNISAYMAELEARLAAQSALLTENAELKRMLGGREEGVEGVLAAVLVRPPQTFYDILIVDRGLDDGVHVGDIAVLGKMALGRVENTSRRSARVRLFSDAGAITPVLLGRERIAAEAEGLGGGSYQILLPRALLPAKGDPVILPGSDGFSIGVVGSREERPTEAFALLRFSLPISLRQIRWVEIAPHAASAAAEAAHGASNLER